MAHILVIEDDQFLSSIIVRELTTAGYTVETAFDGEAALAHIREHKPDLVLLDLLMPRMDGFQVMESIKSDPALAGLKIVVLSNLGDRKDIERAQSLGAVGYYVKVELSPQSIIEKVREILKQPDGASAPKH